MKTPLKIGHKIIIDNGYKKIIEKKFIVKQKSISNYLTIGNSKGYKNVIILPIDKNNNIIYLEEFRYGPESYIINFPSGICETNLSTIDNAKKELLEESGYYSNNMHFLGKGILGANDNDEIHYFIALDSVYKGNFPSNAEFIKLKKCSIEDFETLVRTNMIESALTVTNYTLAKTKGFINSKKVA